MPTFQAAPNVTALNAVTALSNSNGLLIHTCGPSSPLILNTTFLFHVPPMGMLPSNPTMSSLPTPCPIESPALSPSQRFQLHTYNPSGILFYQINSVMTDFLGVKLHGGLPWLIFDVGSGPAVVGSNSTRTFNDGQWHTHVSYPLLNAPDEFDAVSVQNVGSTYIIVSWDLPTDSNGILINFSLYCNGALAGVLPLTVISYNTTGLLRFVHVHVHVLQSRLQALHSSWNVVLGVISAAASLPRPYGGAYSRSPIPQLEQDPPLDGELQFIGFEVQSRLGGVTSSQDA
ncbi:hypothetical protein EMCRGX_G003448 [Ephydatia muelleri]